MLRLLGHCVTLSQTYRHQKCDAMIALHAKRSAAAVGELRRHRPETPVILMLTGTDLYRDIHRSGPARQTLESADQLVVLQERGREELPAAVLNKARVIFQSAERPTKSLPRLANTFEICVAGHLRSVKDPFRAEMASRGLRADSRIRITHIGEALSAHMQQRATTATIKNPRYRWLESQTRTKTQQVMSRCRAVVVSSKMEGGANVISEALAAGVPVLASRISGNVGMLGPEYAGYFEYGNTQQLRRLFLRLEFDRPFAAVLKRQCRSRARLFTPQKELAALKRLLSDVDVR